MGKSLIIKGADFSNSAIKHYTWYSKVADYEDTTDYETFTTAIGGNRTAIGFGNIGDEFLDKPINIIRTYFNPGVLQVGWEYNVYHVTTSGGYGQASELITSFTLTETDMSNCYKIIELNRSITLTNLNEYISVGQLYEVNNSNNVALIYGRPKVISMNDMKLVFCKASDNSYNVSLNTIALLDYGFVN